MNKLEELIAKLEELFELDKADLDFGIHRIIRQKHKQIKEYLHQRLPETVREILGEILQTDIEKDRRKCIEAFGMDAFDRYGNLPEAFRNTPVGKPYTEALELLRKAPGREQLENEVYSHLYGFFSRYYEDADFISLPRHGIRYKYAIPYNGEEVILHWANKDQYYIKSSEDLKDYVFTLEEGGKTLRVKFRLSRMDPVLNNNKAIRAFVPDDEAEIESDETSLIIPFHFKLHDRKPTEKQIIESLCEGLTPKLPEQWRKRLCVPDETCTGKETRTVLEKHLRNYTKKNTSDYFIHKNLGGFLRHELDFYIKNEVMYLDDVDNRSPKYLEGEIRKIKAIRAVAKNLIDFLAQFEDFQKKLWLKKKFVYESQWCMTLDRVPESFYPEIAGNENQRREWEKLYSIQDIELQIGNPGHEKGNSLTVEFLKANPFLMVDTAFFSTDFKYRVLAAMENIEEQTDGVMIHSENFQALNLLQQRYKEQVQCIYIDPPYNTGSDGFVYRDRYPSSSWLSCMVDRISLSRGLMRSDASNFTSIGDEENDNLRKLFNEIWGKESYKSTIIIRRGIKNVQAQFETIDSLNRGYEFVLHNTVKKETRFEKLLIPSSDDENREIGAWNNHWRGTDRPTMRYELFGIKPEKGQWRWGEERSLKAKENYEKCCLDLGTANPEQKQIDEWVFRESGKKGEQIDLLRLSGSGKPEHYIPPSDGKLASDIWIDMKPNGSRQLEKIIPDACFETPKSFDLIERLIKFSCGSKTDSFILDYFAGSGTTGHAVINLNRKDGGNRKYILVEMADYFDTVLKPRIQKVVYSNEWKNGKPSSQHSGISHCFKYMRLESYEDALNNLQTEDRHPDTLGIQVPQRVKDEYLIHYMLDMETRSQLCNLRHFEDPFNVTLNIYNRESGQSEPRIMDLPETFNCLLGLRVRKTRMQDGFLVIDGDSPDNEPVLIIWRNAKEKDNTALEIFVKETLRISMADTHYSAVYINGDTTLDDPRGKIRLTEEIFYTLMFDTETAETGDLQWR